MHLGLAPAFGFLSQWLELLVWLRDVHSRHPKERAIRRFKLALIEAHHLLSACLRPFSVTTRSPPRLRLRLRSRSSHRFRFCHQPCQSWRVAFSPCSHRRTVIDSQRRSRLCQSRSLSSHYPKRHDCRSYARETCPVGQHCPPGLLDFFHVTFAFPTKYCQPLLLFNQQNALSCPRVSCRLLAVGFPLWPSAA